MYIEKLCDNDSSYIHTIYIDLTELYHHISCY